MVKNKLRRYNNNNVGSDMKLKNVPSITFVRKALSSWNTLPSLSEFYSKR